MRILVISDDFPPRIRGGAGRSVGITCEGLRKRGVIVDVVTGTDAIRKSQESIAKQECIDGMWIFECFDYPPFDLNFFKSRNITLVHASGRRFADFAVKLAEAIDVPLVYTSRTNCRNETRLGIKQPNAERLRKQDCILQHCTIAIVCSQNEREGLLNDYHMIEHKTFVLRNPLPYELNEQAVLSTNRHNHHNQREMLNVLFVGRFRHKKGIQYLLNAIPTVWTEKPNIRFSFVGGHGDRSIEERLRLMASRNQDRFSVSAWINDIDRLYQMYLRSDIVVVPSLLEAFGRVAIEGMSAGCVPLVSAVGGLTEIVSDRINGRVFKPADSDAIANSILQLANDPILAQRLSKRAANDAHRNFGADGMIDDLLFIYESATARHSHAGAIPNLRFDPN